MDTTLPDAGDLPAPPTCQCCTRALHGTDTTVRTVCVRCEQRITAQLADVAALWPRLAERRLRPVRGDDGVRVATSGPAGSPAPGDLHTLNLLAGDVVGRLIVHEDAWRHALGWTLTPWRGNQNQTLAGVLRFLTVNLRWACGAYDDVDSLSRDLSAVLRDMRAAVTGDHRRPTELAVTCPLPVDAGPGGEESVCGGALLYDPQAARIRCTACHTSLDYTQWADLALDTGALTALTLPGVLPDAA